MRKKRLNLAVGIIALAALAGAPALVAQKPAAAPPAPKAPGQSSKVPIETFTLDNGMKFLVVERHNAPVISFYTYADVGSVQEVKGITGMAHMFEHMAFKGTRVRRRLREGYRSSRFYRSPWKRSSLGRLLHR